MCKRLYQLGIVNRKSLILKWPEIPKMFIRHFIRGYFDGDGNVHKRKNNGYCIVTILGTYDVLKTIRSNFSKIYGKSIGSISKRKNIYALCLHGNPSCLSFGEWLYFDSIIELKRKKDVFTEIQSNLAKTSSL